MTSARHRYMMSTIMNVLCKAETQPRLQLIQFISIHSAEDTVAEMLPCACCKQLPGPMKNEYILPRRVISHESSQSQATSVTQNQKTAGVPARLFLWRNLSAKVKQELMWGALATYMQSPCISRLWFRVTKFILTASFVSI